VKREELSAGRSHAIVHLDQMQSRQIREARQVKMEDMVTFLSCSEKNTSQKFNMDVV